MAALGVILILLGFGSWILFENGYTFRWLSWADDMQPGFGIGVGVIGLVVLIAGVVMSRRKSTNVTINNTPDGPGQYGPPN